MSTPVANASLDLAPAPRRQIWLEIALILLVFYLNSGWQVPDNNEAHYLGKARHYWDPTFCAGDAFFESAHTHQVFYALLGWWTLYLPLPAVAWIGRLLTWGLMAVGWQRLSWRLVARPWWSVFSAALMIALQERCQVAGEWLVGGFEAKGIAYALVFFGLDAAMAGKWRAVWLWLGAASAWHVLVGGWSVLALLPAWWLEYRAGKAPGIRALMAPLAIGGLLALPALIPALELTMGAAPEIVDEANRIYVFERLPHHLSPATFPPRGVAILGLLLLATGVISRAMPASVATRTLWRFALASAAIWVTGWLIAKLGGFTPDRGAWLLKYYWFRLADVAIPIGGALAAIGYLNYALRSSPNWGRAWLTAAACYAAFHVADFGIQTHTLGYPRADRPGKVLDAEAWREVCEWIAENTPRDAKFITPRQNQSFKWYAERPEVVTWKDVPQDARSIVRWNELLTEVYGHPDDTWSWDAMMLLMDWEELCAFGKRLNADYLILESDGAYVLRYKGVHDSRIVLGEEYVDTQGVYFVYKLSPESVLRRLPPGPPSE
ncbi:MAG: DUF6798 domain-containing protein [Planctomycetia bacterium]|nr:DUF6798 domain-containing protein [Planctomycetia bacterium]